ncbi:glycosyltransferase [Pseudomonas sp. Hg5Tf]|uniref:glycosyltransferase n=1 Tax=Pseudomonas sp. Hg5Tf TaxID=3067780 RepID=UPI00244D625C|nr:glycosyltransferase [Pseudomonas sp. Hg5Tf]MDH2557799.1 glycosyltransferase [Pseudomonas sp. Hg5Tf]
MTDSALVLLAAYNGASYIEEQLDTIFRSKCSSEFSVVVGLDPSTDNTQLLLSSYKHTLKVLSHQTPSGSASQNFSRLMAYAREQDGSYYFLCDQDDYWFDDKIQLGLENIKRMEGLYGDNVPLLLFTDAQVVRQDLSLISPSFWQYEGLDVSISASYRNLVVQNVGQSCTFVFNRALLNKVGEIPLDVRMHDHWIMLVASVFGRIEYLARPTLQYRQHEKNVIGSQGSGLSAAVGRVLFRRAEILSALAASQRQASMFVDKYGAELKEAQLEFFKSFSTLSGRNFLHRKYFCAIHSMRMASFYRTIGFYLFI